MRRGGTQRLITNSETIQAILTSFGKDSACIFFMTWLRYIFLNGRLAGTEFRRYLLVKHTGDD